MNNAPDIVLLGDPVEQSRSPAFQNAGLAAIGAPWTYGVRRVDADGVRRAFDELRQGLGAREPLGSVEDGLSRATCTRRARTRVAN